MVPLWMGLSQNAVLARQDLVTNNIAKNPSATIVICDSNSRLQARQEELHPYHLTAIVSHATIGHLAALEAVSPALALP